MTTLELKGDESIIKAMKAAMEDVCNCPGCVKRGEPAAITLEHMVEVLLTSDLNVDDEGGMIATNILINTVANSDHPDELFAAIFLHATEELPKLMKVYAAGKRGEPVSEGSKYEVEHVATKARKLDS